MTAPPLVGFAAMLERFPPDQAVTLATLAEHSGFAGVAASDPFQPWVPRQGHASSVWPVLGAIGAGTAGELGAGSVTPTFRVHPAVVAQQSATLAALYPGRHWLALSAGDAINEHIVGGYWPEAPERINRLFDAIELIRKLFAASAAGKDAKHAGSFYRLESTRLWTIPPELPRILVATNGPVTAKRAGRTADGLMVSSVAVEKAAQLLERFDAGVRETGRGRADTLRVVRLDISWAETEELALENAVREWPNGGMTFPRGDIRSPHDLAQIARLVRPEDVSARMLVSSELDAHRAHIQRYLDAGFDRVYLHNTSPDQRGWIELFGREVLPGLVA